MVDKYRRCVGMMVLNHNNEILVGKRLDHPSGHWQMPQGGIDENENPEEAVWREMYEEIGTKNAKMIKKSSQWINYEIPSETLKTLPWGHKFIGQTQKWFLMKFIGNESEINIKTKKPEFLEWKWLNVDDLPKIAVNFKRDIYQNLKKT